MKFCVYILLCLTFLLSFPAAVISASEQAVDLSENAPAELRGRLDAGMSAAEHPLIVRHLISIRSLVDVEWASVALPEFEEERAVALEHIARINKELSEDFTKWKPYVSRKLRLILAFRSPLDGTLHQYRLTLPENWSADKEYPLIVWLHGGGDTHPIRFIWRGMELPFDNDLNQFVDIDRGAREAYVLEPRDRGTGYRGVSQTHIFDILNDVRKHFKIDEDRVYMSGFSMGGSGTWSVALRTPDRWAAIAPFAGRLDPTIGTGLSANLAIIPTLIWQGDQDSTAGVNAYAIKQQELQKYGNEPTMVVVADRGHVYYEADRQAAFRWLLQHRRERPEKFTFTADSSENLGIFGISMMRNENANCYPRFTCRIEGDTVHIDSEGTEGLAVELGEGGLGLSGDVTVLWNGEQQYQGPVRRVLLGEYPDRRARRR